RGNILSCLVPRPAVLAAAPRDSADARARPLPLRAALPDQRIAAIFFAEFSAALRHRDVRRLYPAPYDRERSSPAPRHRRGRPDRRFHRRASHLVDRSVAQPSDRGAWATWNGGGARRRNALTR